MLILPQPRNKTWWHTIVEVVALWTFFNIPSFAADIARFVSTDYRDQPPKVLTTIRCIWNLTVEQSSPPSLFRLRIGQPCRTSCETELAHVESGFKSVNGMFPSGWMNGPKLRLVSSRFTNV